MTIQFKTNLVLLFKNSAVCTLLLFTITSSSFAFPLGKAEKAELFKMMKSEKPVLSFLPTWKKLLSEADSTILLLGSIQTLPLPNSNLYDLDEKEDETQTKKLQKALKNSQEFENARNQVIQIIHRFHRLPVHAANRPHLKPLNPSLRWAAENSFFQFLGPDSQSTFSQINHDAFLLSKQIKKDAPEKHFFHAVRNLEDASNPNSLLHFLEIAESGIPGELNLKIELDSELLDLFEEWSKLNTEESSTSSSSQALNWIKASSSQLFGRSPQVPSVEIRLRNAFSRITRLSLDVSRKLPSLVSTLPGVRLPHYLIKLLKSGQNLKSIYLGKNVFFTYDLANMLPQLKLLEAIQFDHLLMEGHSEDDANLTFYYIRDFIQKLPNLKYLAGIRIDRSSILRLLADLKTQTSKHSSIQPIEIESLPVVLTKSKMNNSIPLSSLDDPKYKILGSSILEFSFKIENSKMIRAKWTGVLLKDIFPKNLIDIAELLKENHFLTRLSFNELSAVHRVDEEGFSISDPIYEEIDDAKAIQFIQALEAHPALKEYDSSSSGLSPDVTLQIFNSLVANGPKLRYLGLYINQVSSDFFKSFNPFLKTNTTLEELFIRGHYYNANHRAEYLNANTGVYFDLVKSLKENTSGRPFVLNSFGSSKDKDHMVEKRLMNAFPAGSPIRIDLKPFIY